MDATSSTTNSDYTSSTNVGSFGLPSQVGMIVPTVSEEEQQGIRTNGEHLALLPRSVRWRIQLGLLRDPTATAANNTNVDSDENLCTLQTVLEYNSEIIAKQADRFKELVEKYIEETIDEAENGEEQSKNCLSDNSRVDVSNAAAKRAEIDPLTAMVMEQEAQETRKAELYLKYRKERARRKRGLTTEARVIESDSDEVDQASVSTYLRIIILLLENSFSVTLRKFLLSLVSLHERIWNAAQLLTLYELLSSYLNNLCITQTNLSQCIVGNTDTSFCS